jgi:hypothetical protein
VPDGISEPVRYDEYLDWSLPPPDPYADPRTNPIAALPGAEPAKYAFIHDDGSLYERVHPDLFLEG